MLIILHQLICTVLLRELLAYAKGSHGDGADAAAGKAFIVCMVVLRDFGNNAGGAGAGDGADVGAGEAFLK